MRPLMIEFIGLPHAGKSALIKRLGHSLYLAGCLNQTVRQDRGVPVGFIHRDNYYDREVLVLTETISEMVEHQDASVAEIVFVHRGPWDAVAFFEALVKAELVPRKKAQIDISFAKNHTSRVDYIVLVEISPMVSLARASPPRTEVKPEEKPDPVNDPEFLEVLFQCYGELKEELKKKLPDSFLVLNGTKPAGENLQILLKVILSLLRKRQINQNQSIFLVENAEEGSTWREGNRKVKRQRANISPSLKEGFAI